MTTNATPHCQPKLKTAECVSDGHPDKLCDQIADAVLDACLAEDPESRVALEVAFKGHTVFLAGEISTQAVPDYRALVRQVLEDVGHGDGRWGLDLDRLDVQVHVTRQAPEIAAAVHRGSDLGAGDQGIVFGYATDETPERLPLAYALARRLLLRHREVRRTPEGAILGPDAKSQVTVQQWGDEQPLLEQVILSTQHAPGVSLRTVRELVNDAIVKPLTDPYPWSLSSLLQINPAGRFTVGGPIADAGVTGRKIIADAYGAGIPHGGGAFSGKDGTKVDRSGAYAARQLALTMVEAKLAPRILVHVSYVIGQPEPETVEVEAWGASWQDVYEFSKRWPPCFDDYLRPAAMLERLQLTKPGFRRVAAYGHFGRPDLDLPWERMLEPARVEADLHWTYGRCVQ